jgi:hypothetical protein
MKQFLTGKNLFISICVIVFIVGLCGSVSESFQLVFISRNTKGLSEIGKVSEIDGSLKRILVNDVLWFSVRPNDVIYLGDSLETGNETSTQIELTHIAKGKIKINPDSLVRMKLSMKKPMIVLLQGGVDVSGDANDNLYVASGLKVEKIQIRKNVITRVKRTEDGDLEVRVERTDIKNEQGRAEIGQSKDIWVNSKSEAENQGSFDWIPRPLQYPYPTDQTAFLHMEEGSRVAIFPKEKCEVSCHLKIMNGEKISFAQEFKASDDVIALIPYNKQTDATYRWLLDDGGQATSGVFYIKPYSDSELKKQMQLGHSVEVLSGL